jgi:arylsulfatase A-like enzyme
VNATSAVPTSNVDLAPTLLTWLGVPVPPSMSGRVATELFGSGPRPTSLTVTRRVITTRSADGGYQLDAHISTVAGHDYLDYTVVRRPLR